MGSLAAVSYERIAKADIAEADRVLLFGNVMAHEIGHLLLGLRSHTQRGIMSGNWTNFEFQQARQGALFFYKGQARRMQEQLAAERGARTGPGEILTWQ